ncbi:MAG: flavodoxin [Candidatus Altiarchaeota archaeon]|nr:flavodoxin [Candidatus Altiarchaeota archaeon]
MKTLIVYYSLTGNNRKIAELLAKELSADIEEVKTVETLDLKNGLSMAKLALGAWLGKTPVIREASHKPSEYELLILGAPVWAGKLSSPMKAYMLENSATFPEKTALYVCCGGPKGDAAVDEMKKYSGKTPAATIVIREEKVKTGSYEANALEFASQLKKQ